MPAARNHLGPFPGFLRDQLAELGGRAREQLAADGGRPLGREPINLEWSADVRAAAQPGLKSEIA
jgi:hypothetical protein